METIVKAVPVRDAVMGAELSALAQNVIRAAETHGKAIAGAGAKAFEYGKSVAKANPNSEAAGIVATYQGDFACDPAKDDPFRKEKMKAAQNLRAQFALGVRIGLFPSVDVVIDDKGTTKPANTLTATEAKNATAAISDAISQEKAKAAIAAMTPEMAAIAKAAAEKAAAEENKKAELAKAATKAIIDAFAKQYSKIVELGMLPELEAAFTVQGLTIKVVKMKGKPEGNFAAAVANLTK